MKVLPLMIIAMTLAIPGAAMAELKPVNPKPHSGPVMGGAVVNAVPRGQEVPNPAGQGTVYVVNGRSVRPDPAALARQRALEGQYKARRLRESEDRKLMLLRDQQLRNQHRQ